MLLSEIGMKLLESLTVSTVKGLELITASISVINVLRLSLSQLFSYVFVKAARIFLADLICLSQMPTKWFAAGGLRFHLIQSEPYP